MLKKEETGGQESDWKHWPWLSAKMMVIIWKEILCVFTQGPNLFTPSERKKKIQPNKLATLSLTVSLKDNPAAKFLGGGLIYSQHIRWSFMQDIKS